MGKTTGFLEYPRELPACRPPSERVADSLEIYEPFTPRKVTEQAARCMDCGVPFCQSGCPLGNVIPDWNDLVYRGDWRSAYDRLRATNNFPEFTGRICPAPCESACVLGIIDGPVSIEQIEREIAERAYAEGWTTPAPPARRSGQRVAVVGSGPAGLACADELNRVGHEVHVYERHDRIGGLLRYGIPDFKLEKRVLDRRLAIMQAEGIRFFTGVEVGSAAGPADLSEFDAVVLCTGATRPRDLAVPGRGLRGVRFAWDFLARQNRRVAGEAVERADDLEAEGRHVVVIGGGDTGSDCVGTAHRQGAASVTQFELLPKPPTERPDDQPWPQYPMIFRTSSSQEEGGTRAWSLLTKRFEGAAGRVERLHTVDACFEQGGDGRRTLREVAGTERTWPADLVLLAIGYSGPEASGLCAALGIDLDDRGNVATDGRYATSASGVYAAGDARRGQSLIVWAIAEGRAAAARVHADLSVHAAAPL